MKEGRDEKDEQFASAHTSCKYLQDKIFPLVSSFFPLKLK